jgi:hypothetical protein
MQVSISTIAVIVSLFLLNIFILYLSETRASRYFHNYIDDQIRLISKDKKIVEKKIAELQHVVENQDELIAILWLKTYGYDTEYPVEENVMSDRYNLIESMRKKPEYIVEYHSWKDLEQFDKVRRKSPLFSK